MLITFSPNSAYIAREGYVNMFHGTVCATGRIIFKM